MANEFDPITPGQVTPGDPFGQIKSTKQKTTPSPSDVNALHARSDVDSGWQAQHHSLGIKHNQAAAGDHKHNGQDSRKIMEGITITGSKGGNVALADLISKLSASLGFTDGTT